MSDLARSISVVLPAFNESGTIGPLCAELQAQVPGLLEIVVVDDGSTDATAEEAARAGARVLRLESNQGKGRALREGLRAARGDLLLLMDADGQDHPRDVLPMLDALVPGVDMVIGSRFRGSFDAGAITPLNWCGNRFLTGVLNVLFRTRLTDTQAGFKLVRREAVEGARLDAKRFDIEVELLLQIVKRGGTVVEVPVRRSPRAHGKSRLNSFRDGSIILRQIVRQRLSH